MMGATVYTNGRFIVTKGTLPHDNRKTCYYVRNAETKGYFCFFFNFEDAKKQCDIYASFMK